MKRFIKKIAFFLIGYLLILIPTIFYLIKNNNATYQYLYRYQLDKLKTDKAYNTLFLGDSSLGNTIDSEEFSKLSSQETVNCALTGLFGYAGNYNLLKTAYKYHPEIKNVVIMQTINMQLRNVSYPGYVRTINSLNDFNELSISEKGKFSKEFFKYANSIELRSLKDRKELIEYDYIKQNPEKKINTTPKAYKVSEINKDKNTFLLRIVKFCKDKNINLIYVHGPLYEELFDISNHYIQNTNTIISKTQIQFISEIVTAKKEDLGDQEDHILPTSKKPILKSTIIY